MISAILKALASFGESVREAGTQAMIGMAILIVCAVIFIVGAPAVTADDSSPSPPKVSDTVPTLEDSIGTQDPAPVEDATPVPKEEEDEEEEVIVEEKDDPSSDEEYSNLYEKLRHKVKSMWGNVVNQYNSTFHGANTYSEQLDPLEFEDGIYYEVKHQAVTAK